MNVVRSKLVDKFSSFSPMLYQGKDLCLAEIKPYLQPFEVKLALRELKAIIGENAVVEWDESFATFKFDNVNLLIEKLAYWQRVGKDELIPTKQILKELSQNGSNELLSKSSLHNARRLRFGVHNIHEYRGKFFPQLVRSLLNISDLNEQSIVIDPMCGSGTTLVEALDLGCSTIGADLNPLSILISEVKCGIYSLNVNKLKKTASEIESLLERDVERKSFWDDKDEEYMGRWFDELCLNDLKILMGCIDLHQGISRKLLNICLSNILRTISHQKDTDLRVRKEIKHYKEGTAQELFMAEVRSSIDRILAFKIVDDVKNDKFSLFHCNTTDLPKSASKYVGKADVLITSPPYATALPYLDTDRLSLVAFGLLERSEHKVFESMMIGTREISEKQRKLQWDECCSKKNILPDSINNVITTIADINHQEGIGFRRRNLPALLGKYFLSMLDAMKSARLMMKTNAPAYYVVGNNSTILNGEKFIINTPQLLFELAETAGWALKDIHTMELISSKDVFRANRGSEEVILEVCNE